MQRNENANEVTIKDIKNIKELKNLSDEEAQAMINSIKEFCSLVVESIINDEQKER
jgi:hypothetical protein